MKPNMGLWQRLIYGVAGAALIVWGAVAETGWMWRVVVGAVLVIEAALGR